ncbi:hypothetical protein H4S02_006543 [Coemansia sp. RSA 2611]|nr:hypothetical protein H4S01_003221 [Coemansia sp. RSA 2610]KAJ2380725.1 hypothetical protein H4S02_006543 [Coemansia sp. RSA 2611]
MEQVKEELLANHPKSVFAGGRRRSKPQTNVLNKNKESDEEEAEESNSKEMVHKGEQDNMRFLNQKKQENEHKQRFQVKHTNAELNHGWDPTKNNHIRQPTSFSKGVPKEFKAIAKEMKS